MRNVDHHEIGFGTRGQPPEIVAAQRAGAPNRRGSEHVSCAHRMRLPGRDPRQNGRRAQLLDEIVRERVGADAEIDATAR
jgi:hypothetical protein